MQAAYKRAAKRGCLSHDASHHAQEQLFCILQMTQHNSAHDRIDESILKYMQPPVSRMLLINEASSKRCVPTGCALCMCVASRRHSGYAHSGIARVPPAATTAACASGYKLRIARRKSCPK
eukprot:6209994-Pleurochrysis_carterae.AAC.3